LQVADCGIQERAESRLAIDLCIRNPAVFEVLNPQFFESAIRNPNSAITYPALVRRTVVIYAANVSGSQSRFARRITAMKQSIQVVFLLLVAATVGQAQGKGIDKQNEKIRDAGNSTAPASNGTKQDTGAGRGMDFGRRSPVVSLIPNPYRLLGRRDAIIKAAADVMRDRKMIVDEAASRPAEGMIVSQPYTFSKGAVVTRSQLNRVANVPDLNSRDWTRGRYTITVNVQPIDGVASNVTITATVEGRTDGARGVEWVTLQSSGAAEQEFLNALIESVTGAPPPGHDSVSPNP
jgi:hypothetical protein